MAIKLNWEKVQRVQRELENRGYTETTPLVFIIFLSDGSPRKVEIVFGDFMKVLWSLSDSQDLKVTSLLVQNQSGSVLYRHKKINNGNEEIPNGGNTEVITQWNSLTDEDRSMYTRMMIARIQAYDK